MNFNAGGKERRKGSPYLIVGTVVALIVRRWARNKLECSHFSISAIVLHPHAMMSLWSGSNPFSVSSIYVKAKCYLHTTAALLELENGFPGGTPVVMAITNESYSGLDISAYR